MPLLAFWVFFLYCGGTWRLPRRHNWKICRQRCADVLVDITASRLCFRDLFTRLARTPLFRFFHREAQEKPCVVQQVAIASFPKALGGWLAESVRQLCVLLKEEIRLILKVSV